MTAKQYLSQYRIMEKRIDAKTEQLQRLRARMSAMTASYSDEPRGGGVQKDWTDLVSKCIELEEQVRDELDELSRTRHTILCTIERVDNEAQRTVLEMRYLNGWSWTKIIGKMAYTDSTVYELHCVALRKVSQIMANN